MKAYILKINTPTSNEYASVAAKSCDDVGLKWEYFNGYQNMTGKMAFAKTGIKNLPTEEYKYVKNPSSGHKASCATAGHFSIWKNIAEGSDDAAIILEHDALMLHPIEMSIPDNKIVVLGYKIKDPKRYNHIAAGKPTELIDINGHEGAHAYAITKITAKFLINEIEQRGTKSAIDNDYFIRKQRRTSVPLAIMSPTPAIGWIRDSTIWSVAASRNYEFIPSFQQNYK